MDMFDASKRAIMAAAERKSGLRAVSAYIPSGLYGWVTMSDGTIVNVYRNDL